MTRGAIRFSKFKIERVMLHHGMIMLASFFRLAEVTEPYCSHIRELEHVCSTVQEGQNVRSLSMTFIEVVSHQDDMKLLAPNDGRLDFGERFSSEVTAATVGGGISGTRS